jgi:hypothetical protein
MPANHAACAHRDRSGDTSSRSKPDDCASPGNPPRSALTETHAMTAAKDVAQWMFDEVNRRNVLDQETAAHQIQMKFGKEFIYEMKTEIGRSNKDVLAAFRKLTGDSIVWDRSSREWRKRHRSDQPGRQQD